MVFKEFIPEGSTIPRLQTAEDLEGGDLLLHDAEMEGMNMILLSILNEIYNSVDACTSAKDMWKRVERKRNSQQNMAFISENTSSTNDVSTAYSSSNSSGHNSQYEHTSSYSLLANQSSCPQLDHEDLE
ncbi:hypothetical protein Tco_0728871 [Tanacetum coccineum]|uniref:Uncharacterized protein n=1 Tax=Tanacetum coccineum TaxID=301880 RepID=A0ABQ4YMT5_9ASTR